MTVTASALRTITVRADTAREALDKAVERIQPISGPWTIDFPGSEDEHFMVADKASGQIVGPWADGSYDDEDQVD